jgi:hypothetical protein
MTMAQPNALTATQVLDLVATTLRDLGKPRFTEIATPFQRLTAMRNLVRKNRVEFSSGYGFQWDVKVGLSGSATNVGLGAADVINDVDTMVQATADWRNSTVNDSIIGQVMAMNREPQRIVDFVRSKRIDALISLSLLMENNFWGPPPGVTDVLTPWGVNIWIVKNATEGFNGGAPSGYTTIGLNPTTYPNWQNWTYQYTSVSVDDLIRHWRKAATFTDWQPPVDGIPTFNTGDEYGFYTNYGVLGPLEENLVAQNDNLGPDIASQDGKVMMRRVPVIWIPRLEADTTNPVYGINWGWFKTFVLSGWWLKETHIPHYPGAHTIEAHFMDSSYQFVARNRRVMFVLSTGTSYPG